MYLKNFPPSIFIDEKYIENEKGVYIIIKAILERKPNQKLNIDSKEFFKYTTNDPKYKNQVAKPVRNVEINFRHRHFIK